MPGPAISRRLLLRATLPFAVLPLLPRRAGATTMSISALVPRETLLVGVLLPSGRGNDGPPDPTWQGVSLGAEESARTAALFGQDVQVLRQTVDAGEDAREAARQLLAGPVGALIAGFEDERHRAVAALAAQRRVPLINLARPSDTALADPCDRFAVHVHPSAGTIRRARDAYARRRGTELTDAAVVALWDHRLRRFGAEQLNDRFRRRFATEMTSPAWAGWAAVKMLAEAALRARSTTPAGIAGYLTRPGTRFDGHKGEALTFDRRTGELRQPLYVLLESSGGDAPPRLVAELPAGRVFPPIETDPRTDRGCAAPARAAAR